MFYKIHSTTFVKQKHKTSFCQIAQYKIQMNKIKILFFVVSFFVIKLLPAQTYDFYDNEIKRVQFIAKGGFTISNNSKVAPGQKGKENTIFGYNAGVIANIYLDGGIHLQSGVNITTRGSKIKKFSTTDNPKDKLRMEMLYLQVPLLFVFKIPVNDTGEDSFNFGLGPYYAYGLNGKIKSKRKDSSFEELKAFGKDGVCNDSDWGIIAQAQYERSKFIISYGAEIGLAQVMKKEALPAGFSKNIRNFGFSASIGYKF